MLSCWHFCGLRIVEFTTALIFRLCFAGILLLNRPGSTRHFLADKFRATRDVMSAKRYTEEFRIDAVKQVTDRGHPVAEVASRLGVTSHSLYQCIRRYRVPEAERLVTEDQNAELRRLKGELRRATEERDILKKAAAYFAKTSE